MEIKTAYNVGDLVKTAAFPNDILRINFIFISVNDYEANVSYRLESPTGAYFGIYSEGQIELVPEIVKQG